MDIQAYSAALERQFQKIEYISIKHTSIKMFSSPKSFKEENCRLFAFLISGQAPSLDLTQKLCDYALSVAFYDDPQKKDKVVVLPLFICDEFSDNALKFLNASSRKIGSAFCLASGIEKEKQQLKTQKLPVLSGNFTKQIHTFAEKTFSTTNAVKLTEEI